MNKRTKTSHMNRRQVLAGALVGATGLATAGLHVSQASAQDLILTQEENAVLQRINVYFNTIRTMTGDFVQFDHVGNRSEGVFNLSRPGKMRFHYEPPARLDVVADGRSVAIIDRGLDTQDIYPLGKTPLRFLVADYINLIRDTKVRDVTVEPDLVTILIEETNRFGAGQIQLMFDGQTNELRQWIVTDDQNRTTTVALYNVVLDQPQSDRLFKINYRRPQFRNADN